MVSFKCLNNHAPIVSLLVEGTVRFKGANVKIKEQFAVNLQQQR